MSGYTKVQSDNKHLQNLNSAQSAHFDGSSTTPQQVVPSTDACSLLRVVLNKNGNTVTLRTGSRVIAVIANDAPENTYWYGAWCEEGLIVECGGTVDVTVIYDSKEE